MPGTAGITSPVRDIEEGKMADERSTSAKGPKPSAWWSRNKSRSADSLLSGEEKLDFELDEADLKEVCGGGFSKYSEY